VTALCALFVLLVVADAVVSTAHIWVPVLLVLVALLVAWRWRRSRRRAADMSGQCPDTAPDTADGESP
jgi:Flp pilus assembly protein TadB